jgi:hypothetical protein
MRYSKYGEMTGTPWRVAAARCNKMFYDAMQLDRQAYEILSGAMLNPDAISCYVTTKLEAEMKFAEASEEWVRLRKILAAANTYNPYAGCSLQ